MKTWNDKLPDTNSWQPRNDAAESLMQLFFQSCQSVEKRIVHRAEAEKIGLIDNFDAGSGVEDIVREEIMGLLPKRYSIRYGTINDRTGRTAGDFDVIVFNETWFPSVKQGATEQSRKSHFPIEGVYAAVEVKTTMTFKVLDEAMKKLVTCHRLIRPEVRGSRYSENRESTAAPLQVSNPLFSAIVAVNLDSKTSFEDVVNRFLANCQKLQLRELVRGLCVLGHGYVSWGERMPEAIAATALFHQTKPVIPLLHTNKAIGSAFYAFIRDLIDQLYHTVLGPEDIATAYGIQAHTVKVPSEKGKEFGFPVHRVP